jgi:hypothetical protein
MRPEFTRHLGKIVCVPLGWVLLRHPIGGLIGLVIGHLIDAGWLRGPARAARDEPGVDAVDAAYGSLGVSPDASMFEIDQAYRRLMAQYHPDRVAQSEAEVRARAALRASEVNAAYDLIRNHRRA